MAKPVILVCGPSPAAVGGGPTHMRNLWASPLASQYELVLFETGSRGTESPAKDEPLPAALWRLLTGPFALAAVLARRQPALVHINTAMTPRGFWREWVNLLVCRAFRRRVIYQIHGGDLEEMMRRPWMRSVARRTLSWPDGVVLLASAERSVYERLGSVRRMWVVPNAVDTRFFRGDAGRVHSGTVQRLGFLSRLIPAKGIFECIEAVRALRAEAGFEGIQLRVAGSGPARADIERRIAAEGLQECVHLEGPLVAAATAGFLRECDVVLLPTYHHEGLPYTILESLAAGTPVVTTRNGGIPDVVRDRVHGIFVEPRDATQLAAALRELAASPERLRAMSRECAAWAESELGLERLAGRFGAIYRELGAG